LQDLANKVKTNTQPQIIPDVDIIEIDGKEVIEFRVQEYPVKPVSTRGKYYKRVKNSNHLLSVQEIFDVYMQSIQYSWDAFLAQNYTYADLEENKIQKFIDKVNEKGRFTLVGSLQECLEKLKYINGNKVTNAAVLLFAKEEITHNVHIGRLKTPTLIIDDRIIKKTLFETVDEIMKYIVSQIKFAFEIKGFPTPRTEIPEYPIEAIRETVLNACIHRDYLSPYDIQIKIFDREITIYNPGKLSGNLTFEDLKTDNYQAYARNKLLAEAFYLTGDIEKYGSGFRRIREHIEEYPTMETEFKEVPNGLLFTYSYIVQKNSTRPPYYTPEMLDDDTRNEEWVVKEPPSVYQVNTQVNKLLLCLHSEGNTTLEILYLLKLKDRIGVMRNYIQPALKLGLIEMTIPDKPNSRLQKYRLTEKGKAAIIARK
jgi:ATP-dependent DNA helicase RecG